MPGCYGNGEMAQDYYAACNREAYDDLADVCEACGGIYVDQGPVVYGRRSYLCPACARYMARIKAVSAKIDGARVVKLGGFTAEERDILADMEAEDEAMADTLAAAYEARR